MLNSDLAVDVFDVLQLSFFNPDGTPKPYRLRDKRNTQDDPFDELVHKIIQENLKDGVCEKASGPLISPDMAILRPGQVENQPKEALRNDSSRLFGLEVKKLERTSAGPIARASGLDYNTTPPCGTITIYDKNDSPIDIRSYYLFVCQENLDHGTYQLTALALCDGDVLNEDFGLYRSIVGQREKTIGIGTYHDGANRDRPMLIFPNPLGVPELDRSATLIHPDESLTGRYPTLKLAYRLVRSYGNTRRQFFCYRNTANVRDDHKVAVLENPFPRKSVV